VRCFAVGYLVTAPGVAGRMAVASNVIQLLMDAASRLSPRRALTRQVGTKPSPQSAD